MKLLGTIATILSAWTSTVAGAIIAGFDRVVSPRVVRLIEARCAIVAVDMRRRRRASRISAPSLFRARTTGMGREGPDRAGI